MYVGSYIYQCDNHPRQADSIKVFVLCENGKCVLTFLFLCFFFSFSFVHGASLLSLSTWCIITYVEAATPCFG